MTRVAPTPIRITPSSAPLEAMVAKQQSNIDELVTRNRSLEQTISKLKADLVAERSKTEAAVQQLQQQHKVEQAEWREGCDSLQGLWRVAHLRTVVDLEKERTLSLRLKEDLRLEKLARLQRDFQIGQFQAREGELEDRVQELALDNVVKDRRLSEELSTLEETVQALRKDVKERDEQLEETLQSKKQLEKMLAALRKDHAALLAASSSNSADLERTNLQVDGLKSSLAEWQDKYNELQLKNADLLRQLEKWRNIEEREGGELETTRKRKIELEIQVKEYEERLAEATEAHTELKAKYQKRIQEYKISLNDHAKALDDANKELDEREDEIDGLKAKLSEAEAEITRLASRAGTSTLHVPQKQKRKPRVEPSDEEIRELNGPPSRSPSPPHSPHTKPANKPKSKPEPKPRLARKPSPPVARHSPDSEIEVVGDSSRNTKDPQPFEFDSGDVNEENEIEEVAPPVKSKAKAKATTASDPGKKPRGRPKKQKSPSPEPTNVQTGSTKLPSGKKGKRKADGTDEGSVGDQPPKKRGKKVTAGSDSDDVPLSKPVSKKKDVGKVPLSKAKAKGKAREDGHFRDGDSDAGEVAVVQKKKKRKINLFSQSELPTAFDFKSFSHGTDSGLNIPLELSPVKPGEPTTSLLGKALSSIGGSGSRR